MRRFLVILLFIFSFAQVANATTNDTDNDQIPNSKDRCQSTPAGVCVTNDGCTQEIKFMINFATNSYRIDKKFYKLVEDAAKVAKECYGYKIVISGHTDSTSSEKYNKILSKRRALMVRDIFALCGVDTKRITIKWYGETKPIASNKTKDGRAKNRRVEIVFK